MTFLLSLYYFLSARNNLPRSRSKCGIFLSINWYEVSMERTHCISLSKKCCSLWGLMIGQAPGHWNVLSIFLNTAKMEQLHHATMTWQIILRIGEVETANSSLYLLVLYINATIKYRCYLYCLVLLTNRYLSVFAVISMQNKRRLAWILMLHKGKTISKYSGIFMNKINVV